MCTACIVHRAASTSRSVYLYGLCDDTGEPPQHAEAEPLEPGHEMLPAVVGLLPLQQQPPLVVPAQQQLEQQQQREQQAASSS